MTKFNMYCGCYYNGRKFVIGRKYVTIRNSNDSVLASEELTPWVISKLKAIREEYGMSDARRTKAVINLVYGVEEEYDWE